MSLWPKSWGSVKQIIVFEGKLGGGLDPTLTIEFINKKAPGVRRGSMKHIWCANRVLFIFSNTRWIFKVMRWNRNLTKFDMLTSSSSNITEQTLLMNEHLTKINTQCFYLHFANSNCKVIFSHIILNIKKKIFHIWNLHKTYLLNNFFYIPYTVIKVAKTWFFYEVYLSIKPSWRHFFAF